MFKSEAKQAFLAAVGALLLSATCVVAAVGPVPQDGGHGRAAVLHS